MGQKGIGVKDLTCKEIVEIWENKKGESGFDVNTLKGYIKKLCDMGIGLKREYFIEKGVYTVRKDVQGLFFCLIDSSLLKKKNKNSVLYNAELNHELLENIDKWLNEEDKEKIKNNPIYKSMKHNDILIREYFNSWWKLNEVIFSADIYTRYRLIEKVRYFVQELCINIRRVIKEAEIQKMKWKNTYPPIVNPAYIMENNLVNLLAAIMVMKLDQCEAEKMAEKAFWIKDQDKSLNLFLNILIPSVKPEDMEKREIYITQKNKTRCDAVKNRIEKIFGGGSEEIIKKMIMDLLDVCYSLPDDDVKKFAKSFYKEKENWEETYLDFFINYQEIQSILKDIRSEEYKMYMEYKDDKRFKKLLLQLEKERK